MSRALVRQVLTVGSGAGEIQGSSFDFVVLDRRRSAPASCYPMHCDTRNPINSAALV